MKELSMKEFAALCKTDPALFQQVLSMPGTVSLDRLLELAGRNGYRIVPERSRSGDGEIVALTPNELDMVTGGVGDFSFSERQAAWKEWFLTWTGAEEA